MISAEDVRGQNRNTLDDALRTVPGVESSNFCGQHNERMVYVRGFDRWQVPLSIDGVRIYLSADNLLAMYDDSTFTSQAVAGENSYCNDYAYGFGIETGTELIPQPLKRAVHSRKDVHRRWIHRIPGISLCSAGCWIRDR
ncbi:TonB-dependent receptor plug domain-containing protein [Aquamicrobium defluvii]|uniref:TonB-dependent receptor-like protein n=1 Tax=Aquamicrobium defluvii TaxID=69279 RepID=A0A011UVL3_9HYPH|nr:hypothetical protein BG36_08075 [Aquamicrobium defluvii]EZQ17053.1 hypothetical protein CF98_37635 [Halopseudomonas bauzanensis]TDR36433.1 TonB-dependent receptor-like protein [Aquamicrobium defluvii]